MQEVVISKRAFILYPLAALFLTGCIFCQDLLSTRTTFIFCGGKTVGTIIIRLKDKSTILVRREENTHESDCLDRHLPFYQRTIYAVINTDVFKSKPVLLEKKYHINNSFTLPKQGVLTVPKHELTLEAIPLDVNVRKRIILIKEGEYYGLELIDNLSQKDVRNLIYTLHVRTNLVYPYILELPYLGSNSKLINDIETLAKPHFTVLKGPKRVSLSSVEKEDIDHYKNLNKNNVRTDKEDIVFTVP